MSADAVSGVTSHSVNGNTKNKLGQSAAFLADAQTKHDPFKEHTKAHPGGIFTVT